MDSEMEMNLGSTFLLGLFYCVRLVLPYSAEKGGVPCLRTFYAPALCAPVGIDHRLA